MLQRYFWWPSLESDTHKYVTVCQICARNKSTNYPPSGLLQPLTNHVFRLHGIPSEIVSNRGPQFRSQVWKSIRTALGAKVSLSSGYHLQSNDQTKRLNQELQAALCCVVSSNPSTCSQQLSWVDYAHNSQNSSATSLSPFEASLGYQPPLFHGGGEGS